ncbi:PHP domain-containing protein [Anaerostipes sp.]|uniref:PHP domain-containing protein n=1 Tax=Anaerostipes sp. TaxID=1872530 RepID=UPI003FEE7026
MIDLHIHSNYSDGTCTTTQIIEKVKECNLYAFSLTDHDTTAGTGDILSSDLPENLHFIPGVEISCDTPKHEIHILGYGINWKDKFLCNALSSLRNGRKKRNEEMVALFQKDGFPITMEKLQNGDPNVVITRAHFARILLKKGICKSVSQAFKKYLGEDCKYYIPKPFFAPETALHLIREAGGIPFLAHPFLYHFSNEEIQTLIQTLKEQGLGGLEVYHSSHHIGQITKLRQWQKEFDLLASGGSDFHGSNKPDISIGSGRGPLRVPDHLYDILLENL